MSAFQDPVSFSPAHCDQMLSCLALACSAHGCRFGHVSQPEGLHTRAGTRTAGVTPSRAVAVMRSLAAAVAAAMARPVAAGVTAAAVLEGEPSSSVA